MKIIELIGINKFFANGKETFAALSEVSCSFANVGFYFIVGKSGSGKSTLLNIIGGLEKPTSGSLKEDKAIRKAFVFQDENFIFPLSLMDNLRLVCENEERINTILSEVGLLSKKGSSISVLSKGERARLAIAKALLTEADVILLDEPTGNLDSSNSANVMSLLKELSKNVLVIAVTHDVGSAERFGDVIITLSDGRIAGIKTVSPPPMVPQKEKKRVQRKGIPLRMALDYASKKTEPKKGKFWLSLVNLALSSSLLLIGFNFLFQSKEDVVGRAVESSDISSYGVSTEGAPYGRLKSTSFDGMSFFEALAEEGVNLRLGRGIDKSENCFIYEECPEASSFPAPEDDQIIVSDYWVYRGYLSLGSSFDEEGVKLTVSYVYDSGYEDYPLGESNYPIMDNCSRCYVNEATFKSIQLCSPLEMRDFMIEPDESGIINLFSYEQIESPEIVYGAAPSAVGDVMVSKAYANGVFGEGNESAIVGTTYNLTSSALDPIPLNKYVKAFTVTGVYDSSDEDVFGISSALMTALQEERFYHSISSFFVADKSEISKLADEIAQGNIQISSYQDNKVQSAIYFFQSAETFRNVFLVSSAVFLLIAASFLLSYCLGNVKDSEKDIALLKLAGKSEGSINFMFFLTNIFLVLVALVASYALGTVATYFIGQTMSNGFQIGFNPLGVSIWSYLLSLVILFLVPLGVSLISSRRIKQTEIAAVFKRNLV
jgi:ABC-type lipoprotein export system ATPase subunit